MIKLAEQKAVSVFKCSLAVFWGVDNKSIYYRLRDCIYSHSDLCKSTCLPEIILGVCSP